MSGSKHQFSAKSPELLVFDLDGTLIDSQKDIATAINLTLTQYGVAPVSAEVVSQHIGTGVQPLIISTLKEAGVTAIEAVLERFAQNYLEHISEETAYYPGIEEVLKHYHNFPMAILTNKSNRFVEPLSQKLKFRQYFKDIYGRESFATCKPDPGPLRSIADRFCVALDSIVMIGDTTTDMLAGKAAGTSVCAVTYGYGRAGDLRSHEPNYVVERPTDLIGLFLRPWHE